MYFLCYFLVNTLLLSFGFLQNKTKMGIQNVYLIQFSAGNVANYFHGDFIKQKNGSC